VENLKKIYFNLDEGRQLEPKDIKLRMLNCPEEIRVTEAGIRLSAVTDGNEQRSEAAGEKLLRCLVSFCEKVRERSRHF